MGQKALLLNANRLLQVGHSRDQRRRGLRVPSERGQEVDDALETVADSQGTTTTQRPTRPPNSRKGYHY
jgi:hypothetical protein